MKKFFVVIASFVLCILSTISLTSCKGVKKDDNVIYVNTNAYFAPFEYYDGTEIKGVDVDIMNLVGEKLGKTVIIENTDFEFIIDNVSSGKKYDCGAAGLTILPEREALVDFSIPYFKSKQYVIFKQGELEKDGNNLGEDYLLWSSLAGKNIGVQTDTAGDIYVGGEIEKGELFSTGAKKTLFSSAQLAVDALGIQVDAVVVDQLPATYITNKNAGLTCLALYYDGNTATIEEYAICVNKENPELLKAINEVLVELGEEGVNALVNKHLGFEETKEKAGFIKNFIKVFSEIKYLEMLIEGLKITLIVSIGASILGLILGMIVAVVKITATNSKSKIFKVLEVICNVYVTVIRGTPVALQLFVMTFVIFAIKGFPTEIIAIIAFGVNSGAYVSENIRAGITSVDKGQTEAGRSLGLSSKRTMIGIVIPQGIKNVIPSIGNELIALVKETSIVSMIGMFDLTQASKVIGSGHNLASFIAPMTVVACFYLAIVYLLTLGVKFTERRLRASDKR